MARAVTQRFEEMVLEVEFDPIGAAGTYTKICGITDVSVTRQSNVDTVEVPDCDDESLPHELQREVRSQEVTISGSGVWALGSHRSMHDWWVSGNTLSVRIRNAKADADGATGDPITETGPAILVSLNNARQKGQRVTADIEIQFDGLPTVADKA